MADGAVTAMLREAIPGKVEAALRQLLAFSIGFPDPVKVEHRLARLRRA